MKIIQRKNIKIRKKFKKQVFMSILFKNIRLITPHEILKGYGV